MAWKAITFVAGLALVVTTSVASLLPSTSTSDGVNTKLIPLEFPNTAYIPGDLTEQLGVDVFFSLWFVFLNDDIVTSEKEFTVLAPVNQSKFNPRTMEAAELRQLVLNHLILGVALTDRQLHQPFTVTSMGGTKLQFQPTPSGDVLINGIRIQANASVPRGSILVMEEYIVGEGDESAAGSSNFPMIELGTHNANDAMFELANKPVRLEDIGMPLANRKMSTVSQPFYKELIEVLSFLRSGTSEFLKYLQSAHIWDALEDDEEYTVFIPLDDSFAQYYPVDWGFQPFDVDDFVRETMINHIVKGKVRQASLVNGQVLNTLGGKQLSVHNNPKLMVNKVEIFDGDTPVSRGNIMFIADLLFVDSGVVQDWNERHRDKESAPLIAFPWYRSQFLSHTYNTLTDKEIFSHVLDYLNMTNELIDDLPSHDANHNMIQYTMFVPQDGAFYGVIPQDVPDPFYLDAEFRRDTLLSHFVARRIYAHELVDGATFQSVNNRMIRITKQGNMTFVNDAILQDAGTYIYNLGNVFAIDRVLYVTQDLINKVFTKHADKIQPFSGGEFGNNVNPSELGTSAHENPATEVVDLVALLNAGHFDAVTPPSASPPFLLEPDSEVERSVNVKPVSPVISSAVAPASSHASGAIPVGPKRLSAL